MVLRDGNGVIWASGALTLDPAWVSAATSYGHVVAFYGPKLGVRTPPGLTERTYTTAARRAEFLEGRTQGLTTVATVTWHGAAEEDLEWLVAEPGSYGQPLPVVFAPAASFRIHGGPDMFGLTPVQPGRSVPTAPISALIAHISRTDVDLICPAQPAATNYIAGVHYGEGHEGHAEAGDLDDRSGDALAPVECAEEGQFAFVQRRPSVSCGSAR
ncbi:hypothetical protein GCM10009555_078710 [Acrocarpospora macrocephala]|uniref:Uncharacterized protein n=1 Tax=Acrocarpospora macrocephala TaxID=150177 RepID=A0A5M3X6K2_9ACTN|nr:hypothetical protein Amac_098700 [Acrocarpospora macrocephala]